MTKFNVGDEIKVTQNTSCIGDKNTAGWHVSGQGIVKIGAIGMIESVVGNLIEARFKEEDVEDGARGFSRKLRFDEIESVESKPTKNQRITALENEVAELKLIVHELRDGRKTMRDVMNEVLSEPSTTNTVEDIIEFEGKQYKKVDREAHEGDVVTFDRGTPDITKGKFYKVGLSEAARKLSVIDDLGFQSRYIYFGETIPKDVYELIEPTLTPNQQRAAIIEQAEKFIWDSLKGQYYTVPGRVISFSNTHGYRARHDFEFIVNTDKRTIVALILDGDYNNRVCQRGIAKCDPNDVFNEHIGKAIALGRALGLDVSEFEQAMQPNEVVPGHIIVWNESPDEPHEVVTKNGDWFDFIYLKDNKRYNNHEYCEIEEFTTILNDTNAKYEEGQ